jgi:glucokinase
MTAPVFGAVDWGGTWIRVALVEEGQIRHHERVRRPSALPEQYAAIAGLLRRDSDALGRAPLAIGVGVAGIVQGREVMTAINLGITSPTDVTAGLAAVVEQPVFLVNDLQAPALTLAATWPAGTTAVLSMGTGVGGAVLADGRLVTGNGGAGDFGHMVVDFAGPRCPCGGTGCLEMFASGRVLAEAAEELASGAPAPSEFLAARRRSGGPLHAGDLQDAATAGDSAAEARLRTSARAFAAGLRTVVATHDPDRIVLVGALLSESAPFGRLVRERWAALRPAWCRTELLHVGGDEDAALLGAARFAAAQYER